ncbi:MAG: HEAT repeat domain-containing protein, partial [Planctomycetota bacterium]
MAKRTAPQLLFLFLCALLLAGDGWADTFPGYAALRERAKKLWTGENPAKGAYLVLVPPDSPLLPAAEKLARFRKAEIVNYAPDAPEASLETLIQKRARYVAVFAEPKAMDVNLLRKFIVLSTLLDEDPFCDFALGFVTASSPAKAEAFVSRIIQAAKRPVAGTTMQWCVSNISQKYEGDSFIKGMPGDAHYVAPGDMDYARKALMDLSRGGFIHIGGCGDPEGIWLFDDQRNLDPKKHWPYDPKKVGQDPKREMPRVKAADFKNLKLNNAVVWTHVCHIGSVGRVFVEGDIVSTFGRCERVEAYMIPKGRSVALAVIDAGVSAYIAPLGPNFGAQSDIEQCAASELGLPLGDVMRRAYHDVVMDTRGHPEKIGIYIPGKPAHWDPDDFVNHNSPHHRALYGDPLFAPFKGRTSPQTVVIESKEEEKGITLTFRVAGEGWLGRTWYGNRGADPGRGRIYEAIPLKRPVKAVSIGTVETQSAEGKPFPIASQAALLEKIDGKTLLHIQLVTTGAEVLRKQGAEVKIFVHFGKGSPVATREAFQDRGEGKGRPLPPGAEEKKYVILTNLAESDGYFRAVKKLKEIHPEAEVLPFEGNDPGAVKAKLKALEPRFVAVVLKPTDIDVNFQSRLLTLCTQMDDDPFCDFSFGYITGGNSTEAHQFVKNIAKARKKGLPKKMLYMPTIARRPSMRSEMTTAQSYFVDWPMVYLGFGEIQGKAMTEAEAIARMRENLADFSGNGVILMGGHGSPEGIHGNISGMALRMVKPRLFPAVVYNFACLTGCVSRAYQWPKEPGAATVEARKVSPGKSMALAVLASGATAYVASIEPRPAGPGMSGELIMAMNEGMTLGEVRRREYDMLALAFLSWGEKGLVVPLYKDGDPRRGGNDSVRDIMMIDSSGAVLYGDPAFKIQEKERDLIATELTAEGKGYRLECTLNVTSYVIGFDPYKSWDKGRGLAHKVYAVVDLPDDAPKIEKVELVEVKNHVGADIDTRYLTWAVDRRGPKRKLHVKVNCPSGLVRFQGTKAVFRINPDPEGAVEEAKKEDGGEGAEGSSEVDKALATPYHLGNREWSLGSFLAYIERLVTMYEKSGWGKVSFVFDDDAKFARAEMVKINLTGQPLRSAIDSICKQLGIKYAVEPEDNAIRFSLADGEGTGPRRGPRFGTDPKASSSDATRKLKKLLQQFEEAKQLGTNVMTRYQTWERIINRIGALRTPEALRALLKMYKEETQYIIRRYAVTGIRYVDSGGAAKALLDLLAEEEMQLLRTEIRKNIQLCRSKDAASYLMEKGLHHKDPTARVAAAEALGVLRWEEAVEPLIRISRDRNLELRIAAVESLARIGNEAAIAHLIEMAGKGDGEDIQAALWALAECRSKDPRIPEVALTVLKRSRNILTKLQAVHLLGVRQVASAVKNIIPLLGNRDWRLRAAAAKALSQIRHKDAIEPLIKRLDKEKGRLAYDIANALYLITGIDIGFNAKLWRDWWSKNKDTFKPPPVLRKKKGHKDRTVATYHNILIVSKRVIFILDVSSSMATK